MRSTAAAVCAILVLASGCRGQRSHTLLGQVLAIDRASRQITIRHQDIPGLMPAMTMTFTVRDDRLLEERTPGDLVNATLIVSDTGPSSHLSSIVRTGHAPLPEPATALASSNTLKPGAVAPDVELIDEGGVRRRLSDWHGRIVALTFIYTRCPLPDFCPRMNRHFAAIQSEVMADSRLREAVHLVSMSLDPDFDTPAVLATEARRVGADPRVWTFLTGRREAIDRFVVPFGIYVVRNGKNQADITHNLRTVVIGADGRVLAIFTGSEWSPADLLAVVRKGG
jgi:protein SCO1/2